MFYKYLGCSCYFGFINNHKKKLQISNFVKKWLQLLAKLTVQPCCKLTMFFCGRFVNIMQSFKRSFDMFCCGIRAYLLNWRTVTKDLLNTQSLAVQSAPVQKSEQVNWPVFWVWFGVALVTTCPAALHDVVHPIFHTGGGGVESGPVSCAVWLLQRQCGWEIIPKQVSKRQYLSSQ